MNKKSTVQWEWFKICELFFTEKVGKNIQVPTGASVKRTELSAGDVPRITVTGINNGIWGYFDKKCKNKNYRIYENFISVSFLGTVFYQSGKASLDMKVHCLKLLDRELNEYLAQFLVTCIKKSLKESKYSDQISSTVLPSIEIKLPVNKSGEPDFLYMEEYIKNLKIRVNGALAKLQSANRSISLSQIENVKWKEFAIEDIFPKIIKPKVYHTREVEQCNTGLPYIVRSKYNNGVKYRVARPKGKVNPANVISLGQKMQHFSIKKKNGFQDVICITLIHKI